MLFTVAVAVSLAIIVAWGAWASRQHQLRDKQAATFDLTRALGQQAYATIKQADIVLFGLVERLQTEGMGRRELQRIQTLLENQRAQLPQLHGLFIYDSRGRWLANSNQVPSSNLNNADRGYFIHHRTHADSAPYIGPPLRSRSTNTWILTISRRINHADGSFAGVALATIDLDYFLRLYNTLDIGKNGVVNLLLDDGTILIRRPLRIEDIGSNISQGELFSQYLKIAPQGIATSYSAIDKVQRAFAFTRVDQYPLVVFVAREKQEILAGWRKESLITAGIVGFFILLLSYLGYRLIALMRHQIRVEKQLREARTKLIAANKLLDSLAREDGLTGLANRREFDAFAEAEFQRARRSSYPVSILMLDVDYFKKYNDNYGHQAGDECLKIAGRLIRANVNRQTDLAARYGGEEFVVVLPNTDIQGAILVAEKIRCAVEQAGLEHVLAPNGLLTISVGAAAMIPGLGDSHAALVNNADQALYQAKHAGRNCVASFSDDSRS
ncbi:diguanylate cyclase [Alcaligenaceae bacterium]|nr:diguanylate cyclase [Alcaligenaceae bacterium]